MANSTPPIYSKWDDYEDSDVVFAKVQSGEWDKVRFEAWYRHAWSVITRDATADASY